MKLNSNNRIENFSAMTKNNLRFAQNNAEESVRRNGS